MKILAIDSSARTASVAVSEDEQVLASSFINNGLTHSQTLLPMVEQVLSEANLCVEDLDLIAVANGPGSFTGVRIGVALAKGLAFPNNTKCLGVSTLELIAANIEQPDCIVVCCMDARRNQFYTASFESCTLKRLSEDAPLDIQALAQLIQSFRKKVYLSGDGAELAFSLLQELGIKAELAPEEAIFQNASKLCRLAFKNKEKAVSPSALVPTYLRLSQAERELKRRKGEGI